MSDFIAGHNPTNLDGFEWKDTDGPRNNEMATAGAAMSSSPVHTSGGWALQIAPLGVASYLELPFRFTNAGAVLGTSDFDYCPSRFYASMVFNFMSGGQVGVFYTLCDGAPGSVTDRFWLETTASSTVQLVDGGGVIAGPTSATIGTNTKIEVFTSPTQIRVRVGAEEISAVGSFPDLDSCMFGSRAAVAGGYIMNIDDWIVETSNSATAVDWPGAGNIARLYQDGDSVDGSFLNESASAVNLYQSIDEQPTDDDTTYVRSTTSHDAFRSTFQSAAAASISGTIAAIKVQTRARNESTSPNLQTRVRSTAGTDIDTGTQNFTTSHEARQSVVFKEPPGGSGDISTTNIDDLECGAFVGSNVATAVRITTQVVQVAYNAGGTPTTFRAKVNPATIGGKLQLIQGDTVGD